MPPRRSRRGAARRAPTSEHGEADHLRQREGAEEAVVLGAQDLDQEALDGEQRQHGEGDRAGLDGGGGTSSIAIPQMASAMAVS